MYTSYFGLKHEPFSIAPDPHYLFMSERHREALAHLLYGVRGGGGFVLLTGEIGAGKTTVCRCFLEQVPSRCNVAYIFNPRQSAEELLDSICDEFRIPRIPPSGRLPTARDHVAALNEFLLRTHGVGQNNVLIIDEAQNLAPEVLEQLRLLTNLETNERKLLQIILIGQPELRDMLARPELEQLAQRVIARYHLDALTPSETAQYIHHRLAVAGLGGALPFDTPSLQRIHMLARGVPRRINLLCDRALLGAYASGRPTVSVDIVDKAAAEVNGEMPPRAARRGRHGMRARLALALGLGAVGGAALFGAGMLAFDALRPPATTAAAVPPPAGEVGAMSYILEALRKAEAERRRGAVPDLHAQALPGGTPGMAVAPARSSLPLWLGGAALLVGAAAAAWFWLGRTQMPAPVASPASVPASATMAAAPASAATAAVAASAPVVATAGSAPVVVASRAEVAASAPAPSAESVAAKADKPAPPPARKAAPAKREAPTAQAKASARPAPPPPLPTSVPTSPPPPKADRTPPPPAEPPAPPPPARVPALAELPGDLRQQVPALTIGGSVYSPQANARMVVVNGQVFQEGNALTPELKLEQIRPKTAVFSIRGTRFEVPL